MISSWEDGQEFQLDNNSVWKCASPPAICSCPGELSAMTSTQIRQSFLDFFREKQHTIVPSSSLLPDAPNLLFTNAGMNQFVPIFLGQQKPAWNPPRVADTQKCIRAGGKHNDLEDVGLDTYHHTFFEMLGNWSFGDYFKKEAIEWAWELVIERWKFPPQRLYATIYKPGPNEPSEFDQEAYDHWSRLFRDADLDPAIHIVNGGKADNFWMMGETGPCGPCSELHVDLTPDGDTRGALVNKDDPRCFEIWNLVFIQFNANADGTFTALPARHVDTGMGFERVTAIIQGTKNLTDFSGTISNYETDIFRPIFDELEKLSGKKYASTLPDPNLSAIRDPQSAIDVAFRVIADHIRTLSFAVADGIIPSNEGRGYVLRRVLRRAVGYGRTLEFHEPFFFKLVDVVAQTMGDVFPEIGAKQKYIEEVLRREEEAFNKTLDTGIEVFDRFAVWAVVQQAGETEPQPHVLIRLHKSMAEVGKVPGSKPIELLIQNSNGPIYKELFGTFPRLKGKDVFELYDTYGFPLDLTELMARERGLTVDVAGFEELMEEQRSRARAAQKKEIVFVSDVAADVVTQFVGYESLECEAGVISGTGKEDRNILVVDRSPFYAEMGGQVGDTGWIELASGSLPVLNTTRSKNAFLLTTSRHFPFTNETPQELLGFEFKQPLPVRLRVDAGRRSAIERHHTVTHLLHWALHEVISRDAAQKGSYVGPDKLTFDFSSAPLTPQQKRDVEKLVNENIAKKAPVSWTEIPYAEAKKRADIQQFFGEKYGDVVRVVQIGGDPATLNGYSMELCGGTHVRSTSEIGSFRIVREEAIAAGIRRIEAVAGDAARDWAEEEAARQQKRFEMLARKKSNVAALPVFAREAETADMMKTIDARAAHLEKLDVDVRDWEKKNAKTAAAQLRSRAVEIANELAASHAQKSFCVSEVPDADGALLQAVVDALKPKFKGPIFLVGATDGSVALIAAVPKELTAKIQADKLIQQIAPIIDGKGGGRPESARGAGKDVGKIDNALAEAKRLIAAA
jgi:alanyl-tRNA synthetase